MLFECKQGINKMIYGVDVGHSALTSFLGFLSMPAQFMNGSQPIGWNAANRNLCYKQTFNHRPKNVRQILQMCCCSSFFWQPCVIIIIWVCKLIQGNAHWYVLQNTYGNERHTPLHVASGYETVADTTMVIKQQSQRGTNIIKNTDNGNFSFSHSNGVPRQTMAKTRNKYRPKVSKPSECDDMLFGKPGDHSECKEWDAPWGNSGTATPLLFDSTDRSGHYSPNKQDASFIRESQSAKSAKLRRPWR